MNDIERAAYRFRWKNLGERLRKIEERLDEQDSILGNVIKETGLSPKQAFANVPVDSRSKEQLET